MRGRLCVCVWGGGGGGGGAGGCRHASIKYFYVNKKCVPQVFISKYRKFPWKGACWHVMRYSHHKGGGVVSEAEVCKVDIGFHQHDTFLA